MKILQINENHYEAGGQERYFFDLINTLRDKGNEVYSFGFAPQPKRTDNSLVLKDTNNFLLRQVKRFMLDPKAYIKLRRYIKKINPDVIHFHGINKSTLSLLLACRGHNTIMTVHNYGFVCPTIWCVYADTLQTCKGNPGLKCLKHKCINPITLATFKTHFKIRDFLLNKTINLFITPSKRLREYLQNYKFKNVVDTPYFVELKNIVQTTKTKKDIDLLYMGRLDREKGVDFLIKSINILLDEFPNIKLTIVGWGSERNNLENISKELGLENNITFTGKVPFDKVKEYYARSKVLVVPSVYMDNFPCVGLEGLANGLPLVGSNRGGIPEWCIHKKTGLVVEPTEPIEIASATKQLLENKKLRDKFSKNGKKEANRFNKEDRMKDILTIYNNLINHKV